MKSISVNKNVVVSLLIIVASFWFWMLVSLSPLSKLIPPRPYVIFLTIGFGISLLAGGVLANIYTQQQFSPAIKENYKGKNYLYRLQTYFWLFFLICLPLGVDLAWRAYEFSASYSYGKLRIFAFGGEFNGENLHLFRSVGLWRLYQYTVFPMLDIILIIGIYLTYHKRRLHYLLLAFFLGALFNIAVAGRHYFLNFFVVLAFSYWAFFMINHGKRCECYFEVNLSDTISIKKIILLIILTITLMVWVSIERSGSYGALESVRNNLIHYNVLGFSLLSEAIASRGETAVSDLTYGGSLLRAPIHFAYDFLRQIGFDVWYPFELQWGDTQEPIFLGSGPLGDYYFNAYYTNLYPLYLDGRGIGVIIGGVIYGFLFSYFLTRWVLGQRVFSLMAATMIFPALIGSQYNFPMQSTTLFLSLIGLFFLSFAAKLRW